MRMKVAELVEDMNLYPRHSVDPQHVAQIALAIMSGSKMPPVVVDKKSKRIIDGWHRCRAAIRSGGPEAEVEVDLREYPAEQALILDAIGLNAHHGRKLDKVDQVRAVMMAGAAGASNDLIAAALHVPEKQVEVLRVRVAIVAETSTEAVPGTKPSVMVLKRPVLHMAGQRLTKEQAEAHRSMPGTSFALLCSQLTKAIEAGLIDVTDEVTLSALAHLSKVLGPFVRRHVRKRA